MLDLAAYAGGHVPDCATSLCSQLKKARQSDFIGINKFITKRKRNSDFGMHEKGDIVEFCTILYAKQFLRR